MTEAAAVEEPKVVVYSGRAENLVGELLARYEREAGVDLEVRYADSAKSAAALIEEGEASKADVFFSQDTSTLGLLAEKGMLAELPDEVLGKVDATFRDPGGRWVGTSGRARVTVYSPKVFADPSAVPSLQEMTDPKWKGRVGWAPENASFQSFVAAMVELEGEEKTGAWLKAMQENEARAYPKNTPIVKAVGDGEIDLGLVNHYYLYRLKDEFGDEFAAANLYPKSGAADALVNLSGAAILESADDKQAAAKLIAYLLSKPAQKFLTEQNYEFPVIDSVKTAHGVPPISELNAPKVKYEALANLRTTERLLREAGALL